MPPLPFSVTLCRALIQTAAHVVPVALRDKWIREWHGRVWHQWQFLEGEDAWNRQEAWLLLRRCLPAIPQAIALWWLQEDVQRFQNRWLGAPWSVLAGLCAALVLIAVLSGGLPATKLLFQAQSPANQRELFILLHPNVGGGNKPLPSDVVPAWAQNSHTLSRVAPFVITRDHATSPTLAGTSPLVVRTNPDLFRVLNVQPAAGHFPVQGPAELVIDYRTAERVSHLTTKVIGSRLRIGKESYPIAAVLPRHFRFLTRQPLAFLVAQTNTDSRVMVAARARTGVSKAAIDRELTKIAEDKTYYFFASQLRLQFQSEAIVLPVTVFGITALCSGLLAAAVCGIRMRDSRRSWTGRESRWALRRTAFFAAKTSLALLVVFVAGLEATRTESSILLASKDPANSPLLLWFYVAGTMAVFFWSIAEGRMRCRTCLRRLCSPVRVGSPGCLLLDWSGTELICSQGHGVLHVPHMTTSWQSDAQSWITMDESWQDLFSSPHK